MSWCGRVDDVGGRRERAARETPAATSSVLRPARALSAALAVTVALVLGLAGQAHAVSFSTIEAVGPLAEITISNELNCQVIHEHDPQAQFYPPVDLELGACGTQVATGGVTYGPSDVPGGNDPVDFVPVSQTAVTGTGLSTSPYKVVTVVKAGSLRLTQTDTYIEGKDEHVTSVVVKNEGTATASVVLYRFGDCNLHEDDTGFGRLTGSTVACTTGTETSAGTLSWIPVSSGSAAYEGDFGGLYSRIASQQPLPGTCDCANRTENVAGLSWSFNLAKGASATRSHKTHFLPTGPTALKTTKTVSATEVVLGGTVTYTIKVANPTSAPVTLRQVFDVLPAGFSYIAGSSSGLTTADPVIADDRLTWDGTWTVPANGSVTQKLQATAAGTPGRALHYDRAGGSADLRVAPSGFAAPVRICTILDPPGAHTITGTAGDDVICARDGADVVAGGGGNDTIIAGSGADDVDGGAGADYIDGGTESDTVRGGDGADVMLGGTGIDTVTYSGVTVPVKIDLNANGAVDGASAEADDVRNDIENAIGGSADDTILGNSLVNRLHGGAGGDTLAGRAAPDSLFGGPGFDLLRGNDDASTADALNCEADGGQAQPGPNDTVTGCS